MKQVYSLQTDSLTPHCAYNYLHVHACMYIHVYIHVGMLSKSIGQSLRLSAAMHALFHMDNEDSLPEIISEGTIEAAIDFVEVCS